MRRNVIWHFQCKIRNLKYFFLILRFYSISSYVSVTGVICAYNILVITIKSSFLRILDNATYAEPGPTLFESNHTMTLSKVCRLAPSLPLDSFETGLFSKGFFSGKAGGRKIGRGEADLFHLQRFESYFYIWREN